MRVTPRIAYAGVACILIASCGDNPMKPPTSISVLDLGPLATRTLAVWHPALNGPIYMPFQSNDIRERNVSTGEDRTITSLSSISSGEARLWSVDASTGDFIVSELTYVSGTLTDARLQRFGLDGSRVGEFSGQSGHGDGLGVPSPDGSKIAFLRHNFATDLIHLMWRDARDFDGPVTRLFSHQFPDEYITSISWVDSETFLTSEGNRTGTTTEFENTLWSTLSSTGRGWPKNGAAATVDPAGKRVVMLNADTGDLYMTRIDGVTDTRITHDLDIERIGPQWRADSRAIVYPVFSPTFSQNRMHLVLLPPLAE